MKNFITLLLFAISFTLVSAQENADLSLEDLQTQQNKAIENENYEAAGKYKKNDFALWVNGFKVNIDTTGTVPIGLSELAYDDGGGGSTFHSLTKQLQYYNTALTDAELETLTSYTSFNAMALAQNYKIQ